MYFINEKAMAMSRDGKSVSFENGLPTLYQVQKTNPNRKIVIWNDEHKNIHVETLFSNTDDIIIAIKRFEKGQNIIKYLDWRENTFDKIQGGYT